MGRECFFIEDPTFTSVSVMNGNGTAVHPISTVEPTQIDNLHSLAYILVFLDRRHRRDGKGDEGEFRPLAVLSL